ncbi:acetone carboxylase subunit gamma [Natrinema salsiterrestre]|uniref:acetone carboxylase subunit gamma n=1 Tax=Natrinema salsiterrestre TaxID=2950540 RepID=UPI0024065E4D|nr:acetone carboxylase subunit gamma [Natrinema salsiterrestre]
MAWTPQNRAASLFTLNETAPLQEIYPEAMHSDPEWMVLREYFCPGCKTQLEVEAVPPGYPIVFDFRPYIDDFYEDWLGRKAPDK